MKSHFFILSRLRSLLKGFCLLCEVACRQGRLLFFQETRPGQNQERLFRGEIVSCIGFEQSTCPSSQHSTCLASQQGRCLGSQQGTISLLNTGQNLLFNNLSFSTVSLFQQSLFIQQSLYSTASLYSPVSLYSTVSLDSGQVFFLGKIKACLACNKPNIKDKIPSKVTSDGLK